MTMMHVMCFISKHSVESGVRSACLDNSDEGSVAWPVAQIACLSCCSVLMERASGVSDVGERVLSTPSRLFRHTGQVSCCDGERKT